MVAAALTNPIDVVKTRICIEPVRKDGERGEVGGEQKMVKKKMMMRRSGDGGGSGGGGGGGGEVEENEGD